MQSQQEVHETLVGLVEAHLGSQALAGEKTTDQREEWRRPLVTQCTMHLFCGPNHIIRTLPAQTRNVTFCGIAVVAACEKPLTHGRPVEITIETPDDLPTHVAGTVVFCRPVDQHRFEIGVEIKASSHARILTHDVCGATDLYDWFARALDVPE